jgi:single-stranded DNA-binding protein
MHLDMNLVVLCGHLAADPETRQFDGGSRLVRYLVTVRVDHPRRRVDVVPVAYWDPPDDIWDDPGSRDIRVWVVGAVQRRFWEAPDGRRSRIEVVAEQVYLYDLGDREPVALGREGDAGA